MNYILLLFQLVTSSTLIEYKFHKNFGKVFYDYSGNFNHAINGESLFTTVNEMICTDRGIYSDETYGLVTLPPNSVNYNTFVFPSTFTVLFWKKWTTYGNRAMHSTLLIDATSNTNKKITIDRETKTEKVILDVNTGCYSNSVSTVDSSPFTWNLVTLEIINTNVKLYIGTSTIFSLTMSCALASSNLSANRGYISVNSGPKKSMLGFIWNFVVLDAGNTYSNYISASNVASTTCLIGSSCSCYNKVNDAELGVGCISDNTNPYVNSYSSTCSCSGSCSQAICYDCTCASNSCQENLAQVECMDTSTSSCGTGYLPTRDSNGDCIACKNTCSSCNDNNDCLSCTSSNAQPDSSGNCVCKSGYYQSKDMYNSDACQPCNSECLTCQDSTHCLTCKSQYASPSSSGGCDCISTAYGTDPLTTSNSCTSCLSSCATCENSITCLTCISANASPSSSGCQCDTGYYLAKSDLTYADSCSACHSHCQTCEKSLVCLSCKADNSKADSIQGCVCNSGFYSDQDLSVSDCSPCYSECAQCSSYSFCTECSDDNAEVDEDGNCVCKTGYFEKNNLNTLDGCEKCTENCDKCTDEKYFRCISCSNWLVDGVCFDLPPFGYTCANKVCEYKEGAYLKYDFTSVGTVFYDSVNGIDGSCCSVSVDVVTAMDRGAYFFGTGGIEVASSPDFTLFGTELTVSSWVNPGLADFILTEKGPENSVSLKIAVIDSKTSIEVAIDNNYLTLTSSLRLVLDTWNHLLIVLEYAEEISTLRVFVNGVENSDSNTISNPFHNESNSSFFVGSDCSNSQSFEGFMYLFYLYVKNPGIESLVSISEGSCSIKPLGSDCIPSCNLTQYNLEQNCDSCPTDCKIGCKNSTSCSLCADSHCISCKTYELHSCTECESNYEVLDNTCILCNSTTYYDQSTKTCKNCSGLCISCKSKKLCTSCKDNSSLNNYNKCSCNLGFLELGEECVRNKFTLTGSTFINNTIKVVFSEAVDSSLSNSNVNVTAVSLKNYSVKKIDNLIFHIQLNFHEDVKNNAKAIVKFTSPIISIKNSILDPSVYVLNLFETKSVTEQKKVEKEVKEAQKTAELGTTVGGSVAGSTSLINGDLKSVFTFLNVAEMFYAVLFFDIELYPVLEEFLLGLRVQSKFPNIFKILISEEHGEKLPKIYNKFGYKTNLIFINCGVQFTFLVIFLVAYLILLGLNCINKLKPKLKTILGYFKYSVFLRIWVQSYFEILHASRLGIKHSNLSNATQVANYAICIFLIAFQIVGLVFLLYLIYRLSSKTGPEAKEFISKFATFFDEFKESPSSLHLFYALFILRRIVLVLVSEYGNDKIIQIILAAVFALTVNFI